MPSNMLSKALNSQIRLRPLHKLILIFIADKSSNAEVCTTSTENIAKACEVEEWEVVAGLATLRAGGFITTRSNQNEAIGFAFTENW